MFYKDYSRNKIMDRIQLSNFISGKKQINETIVFTNGCFDLLHLGHITYLEEARTYGDRLIVGLNSDASVRRLKGDLRPILPEQERARMLAAFQFVDAVCIFEEDTPLNLIQTILPHVLIKGGDYMPDTVVGSEIVQQNGGKTMIIPFLEGYSTTRLIEKIKLLSR
jgi:D-beta-D-heptose 7-phosphate kinase/D-beta-D-heptose 1-phosphate adenosyltransferase